MMCEGDAPPGGLAEALEADGRPFDVFRTVERAAVLDRLTTGEVDCVVSACGEVGADVLGFLRDVRQVAPDVPCLLFSAVQTVPVEAVELGLSAVVRRDAGDQYERLADAIVTAVDERRAEREREDERRRLSTFVRESTDCIVVVDDANRFDYVSPAVERVLGYSPEELVGADSLAYVHPDDRARIEEQLAGLAERPDGVLSDEARLRHADGSWVWMENRGRNLFDHPDVGGIVIYTREVTERKRREAELQRYRTIVENVDDVAYTVDESLAVTYANDRALAYAELPREAIVGRSIRTLSEAMLVEQAQVERFVETLETVVAGDSNGERLELELDLPERRVFADLNVTPLWPPDTADADNEGSPDGAVIISRNVTEQRQHERELARQNERLDAFTSVVSHDLRGPLSIASGNLELARAECDSERLDAVEQAHRRMDALIEDLLVVARQGTRADDLTPVDLDHVATQSWAFVEGADATVDIDTGLVVRADEPRLRQFFENLFRNSVEHGSTNGQSGADDSVDRDPTGDQPAAGDLVENGGERAPDDGVSIRVRPLDDGFVVEDDGPGVPADLRETVFEAGYSTKTGGTGFGLMILREIADAHDWDLTIADGSMGGARFEVHGVTIESR